MDKPARDHDHEDVPSDAALRVKALESLLVEKGLVDPAALDALVDTFEHAVGPRNGARVVTGTPNDGKQGINKKTTAPATYVLKVCQSGSTICSNEVTLVFD